ncbi:MAG: alginate export family protein [Myxococcota bacterium]
MSSSATLMPILSMRLVIPGLLIASTLGVAARAADRSSETLDPRRAARARTEGGIPHEQQVLIKRPDRRRPEDPFQVPLFGRPLTLGGRLSFETRFEAERLERFDYLDLDEDDIDGDADFAEPEDAAEGRVPTTDRLELDETLELYVFYPFGEESSIYLETKLGRFDRQVDPGKDDGDWRVERSETWLYFGRMFGSPFGLQVGRQRFSDEREWWWDEDLDAVRLRADFERFHAEVAVAQELIPVDLRRYERDREEEDLLRVLGSTTWAWADDHQIGINALYQHDHSSRQTVFVPTGDPPPPPPTVSLEDESDADLTWLGLHGSGELGLGRVGKAHYWLNGALVWGKEVFTDYSGPSGMRTVVAVNRNDVRGYGGDAGLTLELDLPLRPYLSGSFAYGSGRSGMTDATDRGFRQTGLQDDNDTFRGVASLRYYGELFDPELSNLRLWSVGVGVRFLRESSLDLVFHDYAQVHRAEFLRDTGFRRRPNGLDREVGQELDLILGIEEWRAFEIKLVGGVFRAGEAFAPDDGEFAYLAELRLRLNF